jgi:hypothetical protein
MMLTRSRTARREATAGNTEAPANTAEAAPATTEAAPGRARGAAARGAWAAGSVMLAIARLVRLVAGLVVLLIVVAIVLRLVGANASNSVVSDIHDAARTLVGPFKSMFSIKNAKAQLAVNWGVAAVIYLIAGALLASLIARAAPRGVPPRNRVGAVA